MAKSIADLLVSLGLDAGKFISGMTKAQKKTKEFHAALKLGAVAVGTAALAGAGVAMKEAFAAQDVAARLVATLKGIGKATIPVEMAFSKMSGKLSEASRFADDEVLGGMTNMLMITKDYESTLNSAQAIVDLATAKQIGLAEAGTLVGRAFLGNTTQLTRMGIALADGAAGMDAVNAIGAKFQGQAKASTVTVNGFVAKTGNGLKNWAEGVGLKIVDVSGKLANVATGNGSFKDVGNAIKDTNTEMNMYLDLNKKIVASTSATSEELELSAEQQEKLKEATEEGISKMADTLGVAGELMSNVITTLSDSSATMNEKLGAILKAGLMAVLDVIGIQIQAYIAATTAQAIASGGITSPLVAASVAQLVVLQGLKAAVGTISLAQGGIVSSPTHAIVGDSTSPEVVAPLHKLQPMITRAVNNSNSSKYVFNFGAGTNKDYVRRELVPVFQEIWRKNGKVFNGAN